MENPYVVCKINEFCIIMWMNFGRKRIVISIRCCLHGIRGAPVSRTAYVCAVWYMKKTSVYRSYVSFWPVKSLAELTDGLLWQWQVICFVCSASPLQVLALSLLRGNFINQKLTSSV